MTAGSLKTVKQACTRSVSLTTINTQNTNTSPNFNYYMTVDAFNVSIYSHTRGRRYTVTDGGRIYCRDLEEDPVT